MALVERLMHLEADETRNISVHEFFAAVGEMMYGNLTATQVKNHYAMTAEDLVDWDALAAQIPAPSQVGNRALFIEHIHSAFILAEHRAPTYSTPAEVRVRLGI